jgi:hypothetical protein
MLHIVYQKNLLYKSSFFYSVRIGMPITAMVLLLKFYTLYFAAQLCTLHPLLN